MTVVKRQARQGDVLLRRIPDNVAKLIAESDKEKLEDPNHPGEAVLAYGETHGHRQSSRQAQGRQENMQVS